MKIKVVTGQTTFFAGKNLISKTDKSDLCFYNYVVVPDRFSLQVENLIMDSLGLTATFNIEVLGLSRLATRVLRKLGFVGTPLTSDQSLLLTAQAIDNVKDRFKSFKKSSITFAQEVSKVIGQFKSCCLTPQDIVPQHAREGIKNKYSDLALIFEEYQNLVGGRMDANKLLALFGDMIAGSDFLKNANLYLVGFDSFTQEMFSVIAALGKSANSVCVALPKAASAANAYIYDDDILQRLTLLCREQGITVEVEEVDAALNERQSAIVKNLFSGKGNCIENDDYFLPLSCSSITQEVMTVGKLINLHIRRGGRFKDIAIACSDLGDYLPTIQRCFADLEIPYFADSSVKADELVLSTLVFKFLRVASSGFSKDALGDYFSSAITQSELSAQILQAIKKFNVHGMAKTFKYLSGFAAEDLKLFEKLSKAQTNDDFCVCVQELLEKTDGKYQEFLLGLESEYLADKNINEQAAKYIGDALESIRTYRGQFQTSAGEFAKTLKLLLSFNEVSTVPTYVDSVMIGDATSSYFVEGKQIFVLGANALPRVVQDNGLVSDDDIESLDLIKRLEPSIRVINRRNRFKLFNLLSLAREKLVVSYRALTDEGKKIEMPTFVAALCDIFSTKPILAMHLFLSFDDRDDAFVAGLGSKKAATYMLAGQDRGGLTNRQKTALFEILKPDLAGLDLERQNLTVDAQKLFFPAGKTSVSQIECYFSCPFKHFVRYGLRPSEESEFGAKEIGSICHRMAEIFVKENISSLAQFEQKDISNFVLANLGKVIEELKIDEALSTLDDQDFLKSYTARQCEIVLSRICYEQKNSLFRPVALEKQLEGATISAGGGKNLKLAGKVDRIDIYDNYFRIIDYKTGKVGSIVKDLYYGDKLQLFVYQNAISAMLKASPSGVFYFDSKFDFASESGTLLSGLIKDDDSVIGASDIRLGVQDESDILSVQTRKNADKGRFKGGAICKTSLLNLETYARQVASQALQEMAEGFVRPMPNEESCRFCAYKGICLYSDSEGVRKKGRISEQDILQAIKGGDNE